MAVVNVLNSQMLFRSSSVCLLVKACSKHEKAKRFQCLAFIICGNLHNNNRMTKANSRHRMLSWLHMIYQQPHNNHLLEQPQYL